MKQSIILEKGLGVLALSPSNLLREQHGDSCGTLELLRRDG